MQKVAGKYNSEIQKEHIFEAYELVFNDQSN